MIITDDRIRAANNIMRWRGWTTRRFSILEHMVIGAAVMRKFGVSEEAQLLFLLHDMHETEIIGDVPTPHKALYCNTQFKADCMSFDTRIYAEHDIMPTTCTLAAVDAMDRHMATVEYERLVTLDHSDVPHMDYDNPFHVAIFDAIGATEPNNVMRYWWQHYEEVTSRV